MFDFVGRALRGFLASAGLLALAVGLVQPPTLAAQAGVVSGTVVDSKSGRPLADATVRVDGGDNAARTGTRGEFRLLNVAGTPGLASKFGATGVRLRITRIGYQATMAVAAVAGEPVRIELTELVVKLDELVVTGTVQEATRRSLGNSVGQVQVANTIALAGAPAKLQDMLSVNVPGVRVTRASGAIGTGGTTRIRGSGSLSLSNEPLLYVDGVRVNNQAATRSLGFNGQESPSRINDLNPEEIESIEVLKGPSAATIYGTEASNGVIQIITKRGRGGRPTYEAHVDAGANWISNPWDRYPKDYYVSRVDNSIKVFDVQRFRRSRGFPDIFSTGTPLAAGTSISGGSDQLRYFFSGDYNRDEGPVDYNWQNKQALRSNLSYSSPSNKFKMDLSFGYIRSRTRGASGTQPITTSILWACNFPWCEPSGPDTTKTGWNNAGGGFQFYRPEDYQGVQGFDNIDKMTMSIQLTHRPFPWLRHRLAVGPDYTNNKSSQLVIRDPTGYNPFFAASLGQKQALQLRSTFLTIDYGASADWTVSKSLVATTSAGVQYYSKQFDQVLAQGFEFPIPGPSDVGGGARRDGAEAYQQNKNFGVYAQEQLALNNRIFLTAALRGDGNSAFGKNFKAVYYPKASLAWVLSEESFLSNLKWLTQFKVRGAWGRAGQQPDVFSAIQTYQPSVGPSGSGNVTPQNIGNIDLKPEVGEELELGFDAGMFNQRLGIEFTYYRKDNKDAIISVPNRPSRGFPGAQFLNLGNVRNNGIELGLDGSVINTKNLGIDLRGTIATNASKITDLGGTPTAFVGNSFIQQWNAQGYAPNSFFYKRVKSSTVIQVPVGPYTLPLATNPICEGGTDLAAKLSDGKTPDPNAGVGNGSSVPCGTAPRLYAGRPTPSWNGSFSATVRIGQRLRLLGLIDYVGGHHAIVGDVGAQHTFFRNSRASVSGDPIVEAYRLDPNGPGATGLFDAGFARLRTVSASYDLPKTLTNWLGASRGSVTLSAENMAFLWRAQKTSFGAEWIDPELLPNRSTDVNGNFGYTQESWPQLARIRTTFRFTF